MRIAHRALVILLLTIAIGVGLGTVLAAAGPVVLTVYHSSTCGTCHEVEEQILQPLQAVYGPALILIEIDVTASPENLALLEAEEKRLGKTGNPLPVIVHQDELIAGEVSEIEAVLTALLLRALGESQAEPSTLEPPLAPTEPASQSTTPVTSDGPPIHLAYVEQVGCSKCARALVLLDAFQARYPQMVVSTFNTQEHAVQISAIGQHLGLTSDRRLISPAIYVGSDVLQDQEITSENLGRLLEKYAPTGTEAFWTKLDTEAGGDSITKLFQELGPLAVILAALIDGVNPCAFATIIFFVSYLAISQGSRRAMLAVGLAFTAGVFVAYLAVGLGALELVKLMSRLTALRIAIYAALALSCFVLAGISFHDYGLARRGKLGEMRLNLPDPLRQRIKGRIRSSSRAFAGTAFVSGLIVSLLEFACTGQVYLPMITFMAGMPGAERVQAIAYLVLYNVVFVLPLLVVLGLATYGVSTARFHGWLAKNAARAKLIMAFLFVLLGVLLTSQMLSRESIAWRTKETGTRVPVSTVVLDSVSTHAGGGAAIP